MFYRAGEKIRTSPGIIPSGSEPDASTRFATPALSNGESYSVLDFQFCYFVQ